ncbi:DUF4349 domain-containing protein [Streptomyces sp. KLOTTS4A1]|uniref:DUF4349 domain-containing protein n=1 Tax=Streptomyces sp. KLOTTS4A1 TaxID=3390996 RepID=UPI0039F4F9FE
MRTVWGDRGRRGTALAALLLSVALAGAGCAAGSDSGGDSASAARAEGPREAADAKGAGRGAGSDAAAGAAEEAANEGAANQKGSKDSASNLKLAQHVIRTATLRVEVEDVPSALDGVRTAAKDADGFVGSETTNRDGKGHQRSRIVLRVPQEQYAAVLEALAGTGEQLERSERAEDVTEQVVDVESRIKTQRASVARIRALMDKATKISDVVVLEGELSTRQADLESLLAQQASLKDRTSLSTITLHLTETGGESGKDDDQGFLDALSDGWDALVSAARWLIIVLAMIAPWAVALVLLYALWRLARRVLGIRLPSRPTAATEPAVPERPTSAPPTAAPPASAPDGPSGPPNTSGD